MVNVIEVTERETFRVLELAEKVFNRQFDFPDIDYSLRGSVAGYANYWKWQMRINRPLMRDNVQDFINDTIPHELAHLIAFKIYGPKIKPHGPEWKFVCRKLGYEPNRCHTLKTTPARIHKKYIYTCDCGGSFSFGAKRHRQAQENPRRYFCKSCKGFIVFTNQIK